VDDLERWKHCLISACTTVAACVALLLLALPAVRMDAFLLSLASSDAHISGTLNTPSASGGACVWEALRAMSIARYLCMVGWALVPYLLGDRLLRPLCTALTEYEMHVNKVGW